MFSDYSSYRPARLDQLKIGTVPLDRPWKGHHTLQVFYLLILILKIYFLTIRKSPRFWHSGIWGAADEAVLNNVHQKNRIESSNPHPGLTCIHCPRLFQICFLFPVNSKPVLWSPPVPNLFFVPRLSPTCSLFPVCSKPVLWSTPVPYRSLFPACSLPVLCSPPVPYLFSVPACSNLFSVPRLFQICSLFPVCFNPVLCSPSVLNLFSFPSLFQPLFPACSKPVLCSPSVPHLFLVSRPLEHVLQGHDLPLQLVPLPQETNSLLMLLNVLKLRKKRKHSDVDPGPTSCLLCGIRDSSKAGSRKAVLRIGSVEFVFLSF